MKRRDFVTKAIGLPLALAVPGVAMAQAEGVPPIDSTHTTDFLGSTPTDPVNALAIAADKAYNRFRQTIGVSGVFMERSQGILVFPQISRAGLVLGAAQGDGILIARGQPSRLYRQQSTSVGLQLGAQRYSQVYVFLQPQALANFLKDPTPWSVGVDATLAVAYAGGQDSVDTAQLNQPVVVFTFDNAGLMLGVSLNATQIYQKP